MKVFDRGNQGMTPTHEGEQLLRYANQMLALNDEVMNRLTSPDYEGIVRLGVPCDIIYPHIPRILKDFNRDFPRVQVQLSATMTHKLLDGYNKGLQDVVLTTEQNLGKGGRVLCTQPLEWVGAVDGIIWKKQPLPLGISRNCAFRPCVIETLDKTGIDWVDIVTSKDDNAVEAMTSADLCISVEMETANLTGRAPIEHGGQLPELPNFSVGLYYDDKNTNNPTGILVDYLVRAFQ